MHPTSLTQPWSPEAALSLWTSRSRLPPTHHFPASWHHSRAPALSSPSSAPSKPHTFENRMLQASVPGARAAPGLLETKALPSLQTSEVEKTHPRESSCPVKGFASSLTLPSSVLFLLLYVHFASEGRNRLEKHILNIPMRFSCCPWDVDDTEKIWREFLRKDNVSRSSSVGWRETDHASLIHNYSPRVCSWCSVYNCWMRNEWMLEVNGRMKGENRSPLVRLPSPWSARAARDRELWGKQGISPMALCSELITRAQAKEKFTGRGLGVHPPSSWTIPSLSLNGGHVKCKDKCHENHTDAASQVAQW